MSERRVVVTGMGVITSLGESVEEFWENLLAGKSGVKPITSFDATDFDVRFAGSCSEFKVDQYIERRKANRLDRFTQFALAASGRALESSGLDLSQEDTSRIGTIVGTGIGGLMELEQQHVRLMNRGPGKVSAFTIPKLMVNAAAGVISIEYGLQGLSAAISTACASATNAMGDAFDLIRWGDADVMVTGGSEAAVTPLGISAFAAMKALSTRNDDPAGASRPFDKNRDGFVMGEGSGIVVFEELERAKKRGATIFAEVLGFGFSSDASHLTQPSETGQGATGAMKHALSAAKVDPQEVDYINAHGTGTPLGDVAEITAIKNTFGDHARDLCVSSTKSSIGHLLGASGGVELVATIMGMNKSMAPPTINLDEPGEGCDLDLVPNQPKDRRIRCAMSNSFGFGGHNACLLLRRYE